MFISYICFKNFTFGFKVLSEAAIYRILLNCKKVHSTSSTKLSSLIWWVDVLCIHYNVFIYLHSCYYFISFYIISCIFKPFQLGCRAAIRFHLSQANILIVICIVWTNRFSKKVTYGANKISEFFRKGKWSPIFENGQNLCQWPSISTRQISQNSSENIFLSNGYFITILTILYVVKAKFSKVILFIFWPQSSTFNHVLDRVVSRFLE